MTALERYQRLEATGLWREGPDAPAREVIVSFGDATLTLSDLEERPLGHWALAGMRALEETRDGATYATTADGYETLTIRDGEMIAAIGAVSRSAVPHRGTTDARRGRRVWPAVAVVAAIAALAWFGPAFLRDQAVRMTPPELAAEYGDRMLLDIMGSRGALCAAPDGVRALEALASLVLPDAAPEVRVIGLGTAPFALLPGGAILLDRGVIEAATDPQVVAGWMALVWPAPGPDGGVEALMRAAGPTGQLRHVFSGDVGAPAVSRAAAAALDTEPRADRAALAMARIEAAGMGSAGFAESLRAAGIAAPAGSAGDPAAPPVVGPAEWAAIRAVCG
jgi:hypothetical protein